MSYEPKKIEKKWQEYWQKNNTFSATNSDDENPPAGGEKFYVLDMFPYPSGAGLHVGHPRGYTATDFIAKMMQMKGKNVLHPMGWDAFGLPAENYAIKNKVHPEDITRENIKHFKEQLKIMGLVYDWDREINTTDPNYYKWTQWIFLQLFKKGLAYEAKAPINWCPSCKTGLANEEVANGLCERCKTPVERKSIRQWVLKITDYADRLLEDLDQLDWPKPIKEMQRNWIGKSEGATIKFPIKKNKQTILIVHGFTGHSKENWFPWFKETFEKKGYEVLIPNLPNTDKPKINEWINTLKEKTKNVKNDLIVIGHSLGAVAATKFAEETDKKISKLILVAPTGPSEKKWEGLIKSGFDKNDIKILNEFNKTKIDFKKIKAKIDDRLIYLSSNDPYIPVSIMDDYKDLDAQIKTFKNKGHFNSGAGITSLPEITDDILDYINVFTTRPDTLFGCTYVVLAPENELIQNLKPQINNWAEVENYIKKAQNKSELSRIEQKEKTGVKLEGITAVNPVNNREIPVFIADYVLAHYATGAIMCVPAHDERDFEFAKKHNLEIIEVIQPVYGKKHPSEETRETITAIVKNKEGKFLFIKWKEFGWIAPVIGGIDDNSPFIAAEREVMEETGYKVKAIKPLGGKIKMHFYAENKKVWRERIDQSILCKLVSDKQHKINKEESDRHEVIWLSAEKAKEVITHPYNFIGFEKFLSGNYSYTGKGELVNSKQFNGLKSQDTKKKIIEWLKEKNLADFTTTYKLRDWIFSRQRYWGEPIPIVHCAKCGLVPLPEKDLPLELPHVKNYEPTGTGESPLANITDWVNTTCPKCGGPAKRETNTMPQWAGSCWYYLRYLDPNNNQKLVDEKKEKYFMPVDLYVGGAEHAVLHLLYARFWHKFLYDIKAVSTLEPFQKLVNVGIILGPDGKKMSKSLGNVINPDDLIGEFGADAFRLYEGFIGPFRERIAWDEKGIVGTRRFLDRFYNLIKKEDQTSENTEIERKINQLIKKVENDIADFSFNTAIASLMEFINLAQTKGLTKLEKEILVKLLAPFAPHLCEEIWNDWNNKDSIFKSSWPKFDKNKLEEAEITLVVQVNGKTRGSIKISTNSQQKEAENAIKKDSRLTQYLENSTKTIFVKTPQKPIAIINFIKK